MNEKLIRLWTEHHLGLNNDITGLIDLIEECGVNIWRDTDDNGRSMDQMPEYLEMKKRVRIIKESPLYEILFPLANKQDLDEL